MSPTIAAEAATPADVQLAMPVMRGRWVQENAFKHGNERWSINPLDGRKVVEYPPDTIIPNPARRRLDRALRLARARDGEARRQLESIAPDHPRRARLEKDLAEAVEQQRQLLALRPSMPKKVPLADTELGRIWRVYGAAQLAREGLVREVRQAAPNQNDMRLRLEMVRACSRMLADAPLADTLTGLEELRPLLSGVTDSLNTNTHACLSVVRCMAALTLGYAMHDHIGWS